MCEEEEHLALGGNCMAPYSTYAGGVNSVLTRCQGSGGRCLPEKKLTNFE